MKKIELSELSYVGENLDRPESVVATAKGELFVSDHVCGVQQLGKPKRKLEGVPEGFMTNGIALTPEREFLVANLGTQCGGGVWKIDQQHRLTPLIMEVDGVPLTSANFVTIDAVGRTWISMSTRMVPRQLAFNHRTADGFIAVRDQRGTRIVADGIAFTNECRIDPTGRWLYVNETYGRKLSRFPVIGGLSDWRLGPKEVVYSFTDGDFPDGLSFDAEGGVWVACVVSNRVVRIGLDGQVSVVLEEPDAALIASAEAQYAKGSLSGDDIASGGTRPALRNVSSVAFGGSDLKTVYLGNLAGNRLATFRSQVAGAEPPHWRY